MADLARIKRNVAKMASMNAPETDIDNYIASEGVTVDDVRDYGKDYTLGRLATVDRGMTFGLGRKAGGVINAIGAAPVDAIIGGKSLKDAFLNRYHEIVDPTMEAMDEYHQNKPVESLALEFGSGVFNPVNKVGVGYIKNGASFGGKALRSGVVGTGIGGVAGAMNTEHIEDLPYNTISGGVAGAVLGATLPVAGKGIGAIYNRGKSLLAPAASVAEKQTGLGNIVKDNDSVRILKRGIMAGDDVADQVSKEAPSVMDTLNQEMAKTLDDTIGRKLDIDGSIKRQKGRLGDYVGRFSDYEVFSNKPSNVSNEPNPFEMLVNNKEYNRVAKQENANRGDSLLTFIVKRGGIRDVGGDLKHMDAGKQRVGIINNKSGRSADDIALEAWENGYFPEKTERPTINDLQEAISEEFFGNKRFPYKDGQNISYKEQVDELASAMDRLGVDYRGMSAKEAETAYNNAVREWTRVNDGVSVNPFEAEASSARSLTLPTIEELTNGLNNFQKDAMSKAISEGVYHSTSKKGTLGATHKAQEVLNDMIDASYDTKNPFKPRATTETRDLEIVKNKLNQVLEPSGVKEFDASYSKAKALQSAFDKGYNFKPSDIKFANLGVNTLRDKRAFLQGYLRKIQENVLSDGGTNLADAVRKSENVLKEVLPDKKVNKIIDEAHRINREFWRLKKLSQIADTSLDKPLAVDRPMSEKGETLTSWLGSMYDKANAKMWKNANRLGALALLNGARQMPKLRSAENKLKNLSYLLNVVLANTVGANQPKNDN